MLGTSRVLRPRRRLLPHQPRAYPRLLHNDRVAAASGVPASDATLDSAPGASSLSAASLAASLAASDAASDAASIAATRASPSLALP